MKELLVVTSIGYVILLLDDSDFEHIRNLSKTTVYVKNKRDVYVKTNGYERSLGRELLGEPPPGQVVDHIDRNRFNFQRHNLRFADLFTQAANKGVRKDNKTGYKGVQFCPRTGKPFACLIVTQSDKSKKRYYSYGHLTAESAARSYDALVKQHQPYGVTNEELGLV